MSLADAQRACLLPLREQRREHVTAGHTSSRFLPVRHIYLYTHHFFTYIALLCVLATVFSLYGVEAVVV